MLWFNFILGSNVIFLFFKLIIIHYHTQKQRKIKSEPRIKLNHNTYIKNSQLNQPHAEVSCYFLTITFGDYSIQTSFMGRFPIFTSYL